MSKPTDVRVEDTGLYFLPTRLRLPFKFGGEAARRAESVCARACVKVEGAKGRTAVGWGETPIAVKWTWPSELTDEAREEALKELYRRIADAWAGFPGRGHPLEVGHAFQKEVLPGLRDRLNAERADRGEEPVPWLAALVCSSPFDLALHDAFGKLHGKYVYETYNEKYMNQDLSAYLAPAEDADLSFAGKYPGDYLVFPREERLPAWHLVGGLDLLEDGDRTGGEPDDGYPVVLTDWIPRDGLKCLKIKLVGNDAAWDYDRLVRVGRIAEAQGVPWLTADFNCTVKDPAYVNDILDRLLKDEPRVWQMILYVEQPFPYDLKAHPIDVHSVSARKPLFMDESAHDWELVRLGRSLGWTGVALKTCKTQTGALLTLAWARAHGMTLMVQDLTNPMIAQVTHCLLAAHAGTVMGLETNSMQFYPDASAPEEAVHPGLYRRRNGVVDLSTVRGPGFGYRIEEIQRILPEPARAMG
ncbi:MAG: enolase C-terminal domain-like protein [Planctomycetota bacterium]